MNSTSQSRKWLSLYPKDYLPDLTPEATNALDHLRKTVQLHGQNPALYYFDKVISYKELDEMSDAFACALKDLGINKGDRVALYLQNIPQFIIGQFGIWKSRRNCCPFKSHVQRKRTHLLFSGCIGKNPCLHGIPLWGDGSKSSRRDRR